METLTAEIKQKREFNDLPDSFVRNILQNYLKKQKILIPQDKKSRKLLVKIIRAELRRSAGQYLGNSINTDSVKDLLKSHVSTSERLNEYEYIKSIIKHLNPGSILDLGCGLNPIAIAKPNVKYYAYDIKAEYLTLVNEHFKKNKIHGEVHHEDINQVSHFPKTDLCLMLKLLDILGKNKKETARNLLNKIDSKSFIVSFATKTLSGKQMSRPYRRWFENLLKEKGLEYKIHRTNNEMFYIITKYSKSN